MRFCIAYTVDCLLCSGLGLSTLGPESWRSGKTCCGTCQSPTSLRVSVLSLGCQNAFRRMGPTPLNSIPWWVSLLFLYSFSFSDWSLVLMFLRRNPCFLFALEAVFPMCSFHIIHVSIHYSLSNFHSILYLIGLKMTPGLNICSLFLGQKLDCPPQECDCHETL